MQRSVRTQSLEIGYLEYGPAEALPVILMHGFPDDPHCYDAVAPVLADAGARVLVPWLRGYGPTRFLSRDASRSGQQAALGADLRDVMDALGISRAMLVGYDWGGRAACIVAALWPERVAGLVTVNGYNIQNIAANNRPALPEQEVRYWYQWYFHTERGRAGLEQKRRELCRQMWTMWSPNYRFDDATYELTAASFDNPDFVDVVVHSYRHRYGNAPGDPALEDIERLLAKQPVITVPTIVLDGEADGVTSVTVEDRHAGRFTGPYQRRLLPQAGHFLPREAPEEIIRAVQDLRPGNLS
jgi:pimeloyl-ACP methyl ester carboxylesterase